MEKPKISIIVPIYNMEKYLRQCLDSIKNQIFCDWECILVDDGSKDASAAICDEYAAEDVRFKVIHKENGGLSSARNAGLKACIGDLIGFVDSDDWIEPQMYEVLYNLINDYDADIAVVGYIKEFIGRHSNKHITKKIKILTGEEAIIELGFDRIPNYVWNKLQKRSIITCDFPIGRNFEDLYVYGEWLKNVKKMVFDSTPLYHYRMRMGSIIHKDVAKNKYDFFLSCLDRMKMIEPSNSNDEYRIKKNVFINKSAVAASKSIARFETDKTKRDEKIIKISEDLKKYQLPAPLHMKIKTWWRAKLLRECPLFFGILMRSVYTVDFKMKSREKKVYE